MHAECDLLCSMLWLKWGWRRVVEETELDLIAGDGGWLSRSVATLRPLRFWLWSEFDDALVPYRWSV